MIKTWQQRCEEHPDHQQGIVTQQMIQDRMQEEIDELRQALTQPEQYDQTALELCEKCGWKGIVPDEGCLVCARRKQEPVAIVNEGMGGIEWLIKPLPDDTPLYAAPPKREWVGLTKEEKFKVLKEFFGNSRQMIDAVEAKLKEKNT